MATATATVRLTTVDAYASTVVDSSLRRWAADEDRAALDRAIHEYAVALARREGYEGYEYSSDAPEDVGHVFDFARPRPPVRGRLEEE